MTLNDEAKAGELLQYLMLLEAFADPALKGEQRHNHS